MEIHSIAQFLQYWDSLRGRTRRIIACIPPDRIEWTHREGKFTLGDQVRHLAAIERFMYAETISGRPSIYPGCGRELADGYAEVLAWFEERAAESRAIFAALTDAALLEKCRTPAGAPITTWKWLRAMTEHEAHHRGQLYLMLGMLGVATPPLFGLTSEEVRSRSPH
jgi:uncharacterized damage-inducible protein DinB